jgi:hypothetical protein
MHPVPKRLTVRTADLSRGRPRGAVNHRRDRQQTARLIGIAAPLRQTPQRRTRIIPPNPNRIAHTKPPLQAWRLETPCPLGLGGSSKRCAIRCARGMPRWKASGVRASSFSRFCYVTAAFIPLGATGRVAIAAGWPSSVSRTPHNRSSLRSCPSRRAGNDTSRSPRAADDRARTELVAAASRRRAPGVARPCRESATAPSAARHSPQAALRERAMRRFIHSTKRAEKSRLIQALATKLI